MQRLAPLRVCIVGTGPAGFYTAKYLQKDAPFEVRVAMIDRLPTPYGLVRSGVAPDHAETKNCMNDFAKVAQHNCEFFGNVAVGSDVSVKELQQMFDAVILCTGAGGDRKLNIPGNDLEGIVSARQFVNWYNGHPDTADWSPFGHRDLSDIKNIVVVGQGNVAVDCARILSAPAERLLPTDITTRATDALASMPSDRMVQLVGRRGPVQAAFTNKELRELCDDKKIREIRTLVLRDEYLLGTSNEASQQEVARKKMLARKLKILENCLVDSLDVEIDENQRRLAIRFLLSPTEFVADNSKQHVSQVLCHRTQLQGEPFAQRAVLTDEEHKLDADLVLTSIGYFGLPIEDVPFDEDRGVIPSRNGRVQENLYVAGWAKRGPHGIIGTNIMDARETVASVLEDAILADASVEKGGNEQLRDVLRQRETAIVDDAAWARIDQTEKQAGALVGKPREKIVSPQQLLETALRPL
ncbi:MAG: hypothetical protein MHM6MM_002753 [Cercozoa sp. M6MM]